MNPIKPKTCKVCRAKFAPRMPMATVCSLDCAKSLAVSIRGKAEKVAAVKERKDTKVKLDKLKTIAQLIAAAQVSFNSFIRERDKQAGHACISSGRPLDWTANSVDAGHYRSRGAAPHLRFNEANCHAQSKQENRYASGNVLGYRLGLIARLGLDVVEALEGNNSVHKWQRDELINIKTTYAAKTRELLKAAA